MSRKMTPGRSVSRVSLEDVARLAGVSSPTASKILNNVPNISVKQETRERVIRSAEELGYEPHFIARALAGARAHTIALLIPDLSNPIYAQMVRGAFERAAELGYTLLIAEDSEGQVADTRFNRLVKAGHVDGLLIATAREGHEFIDSIQSSGVPHVFVNRVVPGSDRGVTMQVREAGSLAAQVFIDAGHEFLGHVSGPLEVDTSRARADGFVETAVSRGLPEPVVVNVPFSERGGSDGLRSLLEAENRVTAVFSTSISQVIGVLHQAHAMNLRIPEDLSVLAYDDLPLADFLIPPVTTIAMPLADLGREAVSALIDQVRGAAPSNLVVDEPPRIVPRESVAPLST